MERTTLNDLFEPEDYQLNTEQLAMVMNRVIYGRGFRQDVFGDMPGEVFLDKFEKLRKGRGRHNDELCHIDHEVYPRSQRDPEDVNSDLCDDRETLLSCPHSVALLILLTGVNIVRSKVDICIDGTSSQSILEQVETAMKKAFDTDFYTDSLVSLVTTKSEFLPKIIHDVESTFGIKIEEVKSLQKETIKSGIIAPHQEHWTEVLYEAKKLVWGDLNSIMAEAHNGWEASQMSS